MGYKAKFNNSGCGTPIYRDQNLMIIFGITLMVVSAVSVIAPASPKIVEELKISPQDIGLLVSAFTFPTVVLAIFFWGALRSIG